MTARKYLTCKLCQGAGDLPERCTDAPGMECPDCDGTGVVERDSDAHKLQQGARYLRKRALPAPDREGSE